MFSLFPRNIPAPKSTRTKQCELDKNCEVGLVSHLSPSFYRSCLLALKNSVSSEARCNLRREKCQVHAKNMHLVCNLKLKSHMWEVMNDILM